VRSSGDPAHLFGTLRGLVQAADPELPIADLATMSERVWASAAAPRFRTGVLGTLAGTALLLAVVGVYGGLSFAVSRRVREIGIRRALGARTGSVMRMVVRRGMFFAIVGAGTGAALAAALAGSVQSLLFEVEPLDPPTFATALAIICGAALLGCLVPALRAAAVDPAAVIANTNQPP
jgi:ABC-type antimicrobial peptide transport system permease subunit